MRTFRARGDVAGDTNGRTSASFARPATVGIASSGDARWAREAFEVHEGPLDADGDADGGSEEAEEVTEEEELYSDDFDSGTTTTISSGAPGKSPRRRRARRPRTRTTVVEARDGSAVTRA